MLQLISRVYQLLQELGIPIRKVLGERATIDYFQKLGALDEITQWFCECLFDPVTSYLTKQAETQYVNIANQMMKLVHELYNQNISLESCAESLNFHPAYLSRVVTSMTPGQYRELHSHIKN